MHIIAVMSMHIRGASIKKIKMSRNQRKICWWVTMVRMMNTFNLKAQVVLLPSAEEPLN